MSKRTKTQRVYRMIQYTRDMIINLQDHGRNGELRLKGGQASLVDRTLQEAEEMIRNLSKQRQDAYSEMKAKLEQHKVIKRAFWFSLGSAWVIFLKLVINYFVLHLY